MSERGHLLTPSCSGWAELILSKWSTGPSIDRIIADKARSGHAIERSAAFMPEGPSDEIGSPRFDRRLAAVAFVDIAGYSILMARDETRTHQRWMAILDGIIRPETARHRGKIVKSTGDGILAEFPSAFD